MTGPELLITISGGIAAGYALTRLVTRRRYALVEQECADLLKRAENEREDIHREGRARVSEMEVSLRKELEDAWQTKNEDLKEREKIVSQRENILNKQLEAIVFQEHSLRDQKHFIEQQKESLQTELKSIAQSRELLLKEFEKVAKMSESEAKSFILNKVETESQKDAADLSRHIIEKAKSHAENQARKVISIAIQRYAGEHTFETTTSTLTLQGAEMKGRIIGREGRNIRAFEAATGVTVLIDETPNAVVLSCFDPVRREIARESMNRLIADGRIHPSRIEEIVQKVSEEIDETIVKAAEDAVFRLNLPPLSQEILKQLGKLRFRHSFSQNVLDHSVEVAEILGLMAAELGLNVTTAKKTGLMHDIGKAMNQEIEGPHAIVGAQFIKQHGEPEDVVQGVASHHNETPEPTVYGILTGAADAISASRPGARSESISTYIKRLSNLEQIGLSFSGVDKCFAVQAGRELRIMVEPDKITDDQAYLLAKNISRKIEEELQYPGQIRVTVIRETRCVEFAK